MSWIDLVVSKLDPKPQPLDHVTANGLLPLHNLLREARGLAQETAADWQAGYVPTDPELLAELLDAASSAVAAEEAELRAELSAELVFRGSSADSPPDQHSSAPVPHIRLVPEDTI